MPCSYLLLLLRMRMQRISTAHLIGHGNLIATLRMLLVLMGGFYFVVWLTSVFILFRSVG